VKKAMKEPESHPPFGSLPSREGRTHPLSPPSTGKGYRITMRKSATEKARKLREKSTDAERLLWKHLRAKRFDGLKFRRQEPIGNYIVDFVSFDEQVIVEVDGSQHLGQRDEDKQRTRWLSEQGFKVLRFWNNEVLNNVQGVLETIREKC